MMTLKNMILAIGLVAATLNASAQETSLVLKAEQSSGGVLSTNRNGTLLGVCLNRSCETNFTRLTDAQIEWELTTPLQPGWWHVQVASGFGSGYVNRDIAFTFISTGNPSVSLSENFSGLNEEQRKLPFEFWIYTSSTTTAFRVIPQGDLWRYNETWPILQITLTQRTPTALTSADAVSLSLPVSSEGSVLLPSPLPPGSYKVSATVVKKGKTPGFIQLQNTNGQTIETPFIFDRYGRGPSASYVFFTDSLASMAVQTDFRYDHISLQHKITKPESLKSLAPEAPALITTVDPARKVVGKLELLGKSLTGEPLQFSLFPHGKRLAVLTSWDDGKPTDIRCAEILNRQGFRPTFFMNHNSPAMDFLDQLEALNVEVGSHAFNHPSLYTITPAAAAEECSSMRRVLEQKLGHPVISFGYPNGYSPARDVEGDYVLRAVQDAGYWSGRTTGTKAETVDSIVNPLTMNTDGFFGNSKDLERVWATTQTKEGGVFYFWGHSWQIGKTDEQWNAFEKFVAQFAGRPDTWYCSQGEFSLWLWLRRNVEVTVTEKKTSRIVVELQRPWVHPYLMKQCPISLQVPEGIEKVIWFGQEISVKQGYVDLVWP